MNENVKKKQQPYLAILEKVRKKFQNLSCYLNLHQKLTGSILGWDSSTVQVFFGNPHSSFCECLLTNQQMDADENTELTGRGNYQRFYLTESLNLWMNQFIIFWYEEK